MKKFIKIFSLGKHKSIERFGVLFLTLFFSMTILVGTMVSNKIKYDHQSLSGRAVYTQSVVMSKTNTAGSVLNVFTNEARTKSFVLLKFEDMSKMPIVADDYTMFMTGSSKDGIQTTLKSNPTGGIYVFGSTGYVGLYFVNSAGFPSQILDVVFRSLKDLSSDESVNTSMAEGDASFLKYDQCRVYFNPGGEYAKHADFLEESEIKISDIFEEAIGRASEQAIRQSLNTDLETMWKQLRLANEYSSRLKSVYGMASPKIPMQISGDSISVKTKDGVKLYWSQNVNAWVDDDGNAYKSDQYDFYLDTDYVIPGGLDYEWQTGSIKNGYLETVLGGKDWNTFVNDKTAEKLNVSKDEQFTTDVDWYYENGSKFEPVVDGDNGEQDVSVDVNANDISAEITNLTNAWTAYYDAKEQYQLTDLMSLLTLERNAKDIGRSYTINNADDVLYLY